MLYKELNKEKLSGRERLVKEHSRLLIKVDDNPIKGNMRVTEKRKKRKNQMEAKEKNGENILLAHIVKELVMLRDIAGTDQEFNVDLANSLVIWKRFARTKLSSSSKPTGSSCRRSTTAAGRAIFCCYLLSQQT